MSFYDDPSIRELVGKYLDAEDVAKRFGKGAEDLRATECLIPVLGTQGSGKSSFLNALLFGDILLPVDADETTCIPTVIRQGESEKPEAFVVFADGRRTAVPCTEAGLADYVHQEKNPGNAKGVACIEISVKNEMLKDGIVFVDLPGVGSITAANQKTTTEYLQKCTAAIFMLRTVPPITQSESVFIQGALPLMGRVFWVQNQWTDESKDEVDEGRKHNHKVIREVAARLRLPPSSVAEPSVICVKHALDGRVAEDAKQVEASGINAFRDAVVAFARDWRKEIVSGKKADALSLLATAAGAAAKRHEQLTGDAEAERAKIDEAKRKADAVLESNKRLVKDVRDLLDDQKGEIDHQISRECVKFAENLRNGVRDVIDRGVVDGPKLSRAYEDLLKKKCLPELFNSLQPEFLNLSRQVTGMLEGLQELDDDVAEMFNADGASAGVRGNGFSEKSTGLQSAYGSIGSLGGAAAGAALGASLGLVFPIIGNVVGGIIGSLLGGLCGGWGGEKLRRARLEQQKEESRQELFALVEEEENRQRKGFSDALSEMCEKLDRAIRDWMRKQGETIDARYRKAVIDLTKPAEEKATAAEEARRDADRLASLRKELEEV